jgi:hypothetical protein
MHTLDSALHCGSPIPSIIAGLRRRTIDLVRNGLAPAPSNKCKVYSTLGTGLDVMSS